MWVLLEDGCAAPFRCFLASMKNPVVSLVEVGVFYLLVHLVIWGSKVIPIPVLLVAIILVGICVGSNQYHQDSVERIGLSSKNFWPTSKLILPIAIPLALFVLFFAWGKEVRGGWNMWFSLLGYPLWGFAQEYALLGFVANRLQDAFPKHESLIPWLNGFLFGLAHVPNPLLMPVTFAAGVLFTKIFFKGRHLIPLALTHALFGILLSLATSHMVGMMSVGPAYISRRGGWF